MKEKASKDRLKKKNDNRKSVNSYTVGERKEENKKKKKRGKESQYKRSEENPITQKTRLKDPELEMGSPKMFSSTVRGILFFFSLFLFNINEKMKLIL